MPDYIPNIASQIDRAIRALLVSDAAATEEQTFLCTDWRDRPDPEDVGGLIDIKTTSGDEREQESGNYGCTVELYFRFKSIASGETEAEAAARRVSMDELIGVVMYALDRADYGSGKPTVCAALNTAGRALAVSSPDTDADMENFTALAVYGNPRIERGHGMGDDGSVDASVWVEKRTLTIVACPRNVD